MNLEIKHSKILGGLVPLVGWYVIREDGEMAGPFDVAMEAVAFADQVEDGRIEWPQSQPRSRAQRAWNV